MDEAFAESRIVAQGPTTRVVQIPGGGRVKMTLEALEGMARQVREGFVPMNLEHLTLLPPIGRWHDAEIKALDDGEHQILLHGSALPQYSATRDFEDPFATIGNDRTVPLPPLGATLAVEARNFEPPDWDAVAASAPIPVSETYKWSDLPPLEWLITVPVTWGVAKFAGSFLDALGKEAAANLTTWLRRSSRRAKEPSRDRFVTVALDLHDGRQVLGFVPFAPDDDDLSVVDAALAAAGVLAEVAGAQNDGVTARAERIAYLYQAEKWRLVWFVTVKGVYRTKYFTDNTPAAERFLGRPSPPEP